MTGNSSEKNHEGIRFQGIIKEEYADMIDYLINSKKENGGNMDWHDLLQRYRYGFLSSIARDQRSCLCIPWARPYMMPRMWGDLGYPKYVPARGFETKFDLESRLWTFQFSIRNKKNQMEFFLEHILARVTERVIHLERLKEGKGISYFLDIKDGEIIVNDCEGIDYRLLHREYLKSNKI